MRTDGSRVGFLALTISLLFGWVKLNAAFERRFNHIAYQITQHLPTTRKPYGNLPNCIYRSSYCPSTEARSMRLLPNQLKTKRKTPRRGGARSDQSIDEKIGVRCLLFQGSEFCLERMHPNKSTKSAGVGEASLMNTKSFICREGELLIDKEELRRRLGLSSIRMVEQLMSRRKIPFIRLGHRTVRFSWAAVQESLSRFEVRSLER